MYVYNEEKDLKSLYRLFVLFQYFMALIVYVLAYTAWVAVSVQIEKNALTSMAYSPVMLVIAGYIVVMYKTRKIFKKGKRLSATAWVIGWASVMVVGLYYHVSKLAAV